MRLIIIIFLTLCIYGKTVAQNLQWDWVKQVGSKVNGESVNLIQTDTRGNIIAAESCLDSEEAATGRHSMKIAKYDPDGTVIWRIAIINKQSSGFPSIHSLAIDSSDNAYAFIEMYDTVFIGEKFLYPGLYLLKFSSDGGLLWQANFDWQLGASGIATDNKNNIIACLYARGDTSGLKINDKLYASADTMLLINQVYFVKFDSSGSVLWAKNVVQSPDFIFSLTGIAVSHNAIVLSGVFENGLQSGDSIILANTLGYNKFITAFDQNGNYKWTNQFGNLQNDLGESEIVADNENNVYVLAASSDPLSQEQYYALAKYDSIGDMSWMKSIPDAVFSECIAYSPYDHRLLIIGAGGWVQPDILTCYNISGDSLWSMVTSNSDTGVSYWFVCADRRANYYLSGSFGLRSGNSDTSQNTGTIGNITLLSKGGSDGFIAKLTNTSASVNTLQNYSSLNIIIYPNPASDKIKLLLQEKTFSDYSITIMNILGREVLKKVDFDEAISVQSLSPGMYFASVRTQRENFSIPFIVMR